MRFAIITVSEGKRWGHLWCHIAIQVCLRGSRPTAENGKSLALRESETSSRLSWEDIWQNESWIISFLICLNHCIVYPERNQYLWWLFGESLLNRRFFSNYLSVCVFVFSYNTQENLNLQLQAFSVVPPCATTCQAALSSTEGDAAHASLFEHRWWEISSMWITTSSAGDRQLT